MVGLELWFVILFLLPVLNSHGTHSHEYHEEEEEHVFKSEFCEWTKSSKKMICLHDLTIQDIDRNEIHHLEITDFPAVKIPKYFFKDYYNLETLKINAKKLNTLHTGYLDDSKNSIQRIILKHTKIHNLDWIKMPKNLNDSDFESNLKNLKELRIINSEIGRCHGLCADSISFRPFLFKLALPNISVLDFSHNHIKLITTQAFDGIPIDSLDLSYNKLGIAQCPDSEF